MFKYITKLIGSKNDREIKQLWSSIEKIDSLEPSILSLSDTELKAKTAEFRKRIKDGEDLDDILPEAFAVVRETSRRTLGMRHFNVQLIGGIALHQGKISEMKTGEGKTLAATLAVYLNAIDHRGAHVITVNDYLAKRDAQWMSPIYDFLGLSVGIIQHDSSVIYDTSFHAEDSRMKHLRPVERKEAYSADITYGTNNEFGFDYLRDNMKYHIDDYAQRELNFAIVDEVDSILIDEARTPLIISGPSEDSTDKYYKINKLIPNLKIEVDYTIDEKARTAILTEEGNIKVEKLLGAGNLYDAANVELVHHVNQGLRAHAMFKKDVDYIIKDNEVIIVDEFTGRLMPGRRWSDGLHQAIEAKEEVKIASENQTLATITFQNYFRMYNKLAGMTGTASTEAEEFGKIYGLDVLVIPTNKPMLRTDNADVIYKTAKAKFNAVTDEIIDCHKRKQPVLVGTISIENSEVLSSLLKKKKIPHSVLNAKYHEQEAEIISQAGRSGGITIATNMAGRGTDIVLGGNPEGIARDMLANKKDPTDEDREKMLQKASELCEKEKAEVLNAGGLHILGTERHESRRIDNQLRGRSGRQGDPGSSRFYLSLEDDLMRIFGSERIAGLMGKMGMEEDQPIEHKWVSKAIESSQKKVEGHNFDIRKHILEYDDVNNKQRSEIYAFRREILASESVDESIREMIENVLDNILEIHCPENQHPEEWNIKSLKDALYGEFTIYPDLDFEDFDDLRAKIMNNINLAYERKEQEIGTKTFRYLEKMILLQVLDVQWKDHLLSMDHLKEGVGLRGYGQRDPLIEYKKEAFEVFADLSDRVASEVIARLMKVQVAREDALERQFAPKPARMTLGRGSGSEGGKPQTVVRDSKIGRNDPCVCGSGKKYKKCCGK
ncbi:MAG TPA: preprotein translocase subunit SecA [Nitrospirae bacterium]|nr:preprotein translocase subunit SecA [bacterium BMS3Abin09]GBE41799.1 preprotein translocase subunit SecA [bacterium BMS3Bbin09]HDZ84460.1 preprotein translocase subunit SecA [Nitrospirota bacterium]